MFAKIASFEFRYQLRQPAFWVIAIVFGLLAFGAVASDNVSLGSGGNVFKNAPYALAGAHIIFNVFFMLATTAIGAVWSSAAPEFGAQTVIDRFSQIAPKLVFAVNGYRYGGKDFDRTADLTRILAALPDDLEGLIVNIVDQRVVHPVPDQIAYSLSKSALWQATATLAVAFGSRARVNAVAPGLTLATEDYSEAQVERLAAQRCRCICRHCGGAGWQHDRTATAVAVLPLPSPCCRRRCCPATPLPAAAVLPPPRPPCCRRRPRAADAAAALPAVAAPLPRCLRRSADAATSLPPPTPRCGSLRRGGRRRRAAAALKPPPPSPPPS